VSGDGQRVAVATMEKLQVFQRSPGDNGDLLGRAEVDGGTWVEMGQPLFMAGIRAISFSGDGTTVAYGTFFDPDNLSIARVFRWSTDSHEWVQLGANLPGSSAFANSLDLSYNGDVVAIGSPLQNYYAGYVEISEYNGQTNSWFVRGTRINGANPGDLGGAAVSLSADGSVMAMGCPGATIDGAINAGRASIYQYNPTFGWTQVGQHLDGETRLKQFGYAVALSGNGTRLAVGAPFAEYFESSLKGNVHVFDVSIADRLWHPTGKPIEGLFLADNAGRSIAISANGQTVAIGAPRRRYFQVVALNPKDGDWTQIGFVESEQEEFGLSVSLSADGRIIGASGSDEFQDASVLMFQRVDTIMIRQQEEARTKVTYLHNSRDEKDDHAQQAPELNKPCAPSPAHYGSKETNDC
jgi:hypothetical protein